MRGKYPCLGKGVEEMKQRDRESMEEAEKNLVAVFCKPYKFGKEKRQV